MRPTIPTTRDHRADEWPTSGVRRAAVYCRIRDCAKATSEGKPFCSEHLYHSDYAMTVAVGVEVERARERLEKQRARARASRKRYKRKKRGAA